MPNHKRQDRYCNASHLGQGSDNPRPPVPLYPRLRTPYTLPVEGPQSQVAAKK